MAKEEKQNQPQPAAPPVAEAPITVTAGALKALVESMVAERMAAAMVGQVPLADQFQAQMDRLRGKDQPQADIQRPSCISPLTGATFTAVVVIGGRHKHGRCLTFEDYQEPAGCWLHESDGGLVPDGMPIFGTFQGESLGKDGLVTMVARQARTPQHKSWMWENFYKRDLIEYGNKPFQPYITVEATAKRQAAETATELAGAKAAE